MKKINILLTMLLSFVMVFSTMVGLTACGGGDANDDDKKPPIIKPNPDDGKDDDNKDDTIKGTEYKFEGEDSHVALKGGSLGNLAIASESQFGATDTYIGNFNANVGATITYTIVAEKASKATLVVSVCKRVMRSVFTDVVAVFVNDEMIESSAIVPDNNGEADTWVNFVDVNLGEVDLIEGTNVIYFTIMNSEATAGYNFNYMSLYTEDNALTWYEEPVDETFTDYYFEAEDAESNGWVDGGFARQAKDNASKGYAVGGIGENGTKGYYFLFKVNATEATEAKFSLVMGNGGSIGVDDVLPLTVNDTKITTSKSFPAGQWEVYTAYEVCTISLFKGVNTIKLDVKDGCLMNFDAIKLSSAKEITAVEASLTDYKFELENAQSNSWGDGTDWLWRCNDNANASGQYIGHVNDTSINHPGEAWMSYTLTATEAGTAKLYLALALGADSIQSSAFTIEVNSVKVTPNSDTISGVNDWNTYSEYLFANINLNAGNNTIKITINSGATCNMDYLVFKSSTALVVAQ